MATTRRQFIKRTAAATAAGLLLPGITFARRGEGATGSRRILVVVQLVGGNDGLNTVIPYKDARYYALRPTLGFKEEELRDADGKPTVINGEFGLHPALKELKQMYDERKLAIVLGVGYPNGDLSHAASTEIWQTAEVGAARRFGWLGRYADHLLQGKPDFAAVAVGTSTIAKTFIGERRAVPLVTRLGESGFALNFIPERNNFTTTFRALHGREFPQGSLYNAITQAARGAERGAESVQEALTRYQSSVVYAATNPLAQALKTVAVLATGLPDSYLFHVSYPAFFDTHSQQIGTQADRYRDKFAGFHALEMRRLSEAIKLFFDDLTEQGLADNVMLMTYSEFGRRPNENASLGTDHGTSSNLFVIGDHVRGGDLYGAQPSLSTMQLDLDGNQRFTTDFRSVYATVMDNWLAEIESERILGARFPHLGFL